MNYRSIRAITILGALAAAPWVIAQTAATQSEPSLSAPHFETKSSEDGALQALAQVGLHSTIASNRWQHLRIPYQSLLIVPRTLCPCGDLATFPAVNPLSKFGFDIW
jgi:hypothetical protein